MSEKLQKVLARLGFGSRREMEAWIQEGRIYIGERLATVGDRVTNDDEITVDGVRISLDERPVTTEVILYHKPVGEICSHYDATGEGSVFDNLPPVKHGRWISVGRLDVNTSGLLLFTNNGDLANRLMHPRHHVEREYAVRVLGKADDDTLKRLTTGVKLDDGMAHFEHIVERDASGSNHWYYVVVKEGRNRIVRRLWESQGMGVSRLKRVRFGPIILGSTPKQGDYRPLTTKEMKQLLATVYQEDE